MATTSIWRVNGWLGNVVIYAENPEKTANPKFYKKSDFSKSDSQSLQDVIDYAMNGEKIVKRGDSDENKDVLYRFVTGINCHPDTARTEMLAVKCRFGKKDGTTAYHGYQSFARGEATAEIAHEIGVQLAQELWGELYQVIVTTHLDKASLHNHFVVNTVSFLNGKKYHRTGEDYRRMQEVSDSLCRSYGLSIIEDPKKGRTKQYSEWRAEQEQRPTWRGIVRADIDDAVAAAMTELQFFDQLKQKGYAVKIGKDISVRPPGKERFVRLQRNFGDDYTLEGIRNRILIKRQRPLPISEDAPRVSCVIIKGKPQRYPKATGFRALYLHYCYLLGFFPRKKQNTNKRLHFLLREDLIKMEAISEEARLLGKYHIDTDRQLFLFREQTREQIIGLLRERKQLYQCLRTIAVKTDPEEQQDIRKQITGMTESIQRKRREVKLCDDIAVRSGVMREKIAFIREEEKLMGKEKEKDEQFRRRGGTDR